MSSPSHPRWRARALGALLVLMTLTLGWSDVARAHTDFESSTPSDSEVVEGPLDEVVIRFTNPASPAGEGFELLAPSGRIRTPSAVDATDGTTFVLRFDPPLAAGTFGLRWMVQAGDAHPIDGAFRFEVTEPPPPSTTVRDPASGSSVPSTTVPAAAAPLPSTTVPATSEGADAALDEFLTSGHSGTDEAAPVGRAGRSVSFLGTVFGVGALAALVLVIRGSRRELEAQLTWIRLAGLVIAAGGFIELAALEAATAADLVELLGTKAGVAALLKIVGGVAVLVGFHGRAGQLVGPAQSLSAAVATDLAPDATSSADRPDEHRWSPSTSAAVGLAGFALVLGSYWFDGHTVSRGPWAVHSLVNLVHVGAASIWGGGVFAMTTIAWLRRRRSERTGLAPMVIRFSTVATVSLAAVIVAGLVMTVLILDAPADLFATEWGRLLLIKIGVVGVAAGLGAYNHFRLRPALERSPDDPALARHLRTSLTVESLTFGAVVVLTALLVAAAT